MQTKEQISLEESSGKGFSTEFSSSATLPLGLLVHFDSWGKRRIFH